ncbi:unnamed protein product [Ambrosiozyma monospora]|uniref:Unnamed protein product n=1 Tax=Ambrosiozyma monospora TaxID=43982 RepID=A0ACB5SWU5_AMBMO|nr:unnamed protein product [Ambrosiozyma monospora]
MIFKAHKIPLKYEEIWTLEANDHSYPVVLDFHKKPENARISRRLFDQFKWDFAAQFGLSLVSSSMVFVPTICLKKILEFIENPDLISIRSAWLYAFLMFASGILSASFRGRCLFIGRRVSVHVNAILIGELYSKGMKRTFMRLQETKDEKDDKTDDNADKQDPNSSKDDTPEEGTDDNKDKDKDKSTSEKKNKDLGSIINLMSVDTNRVSEISSYLFNLVEIAIMFVMSITLLYNLLGWSSLVGLFCVLVISPLNYKFSSYMASYDLQVMKITDKRIQKLNEVLQNIRGIKFLGWETRFGQQIMDIRNKELHIMRISNFVSICFNILFELSPTIISFASFYSYSVFLGKPLTAPIAFTALALFRQLESPVSHLGWFVSWMIRANVSLNRVDEFFSEAETTKYDQLTKPGTSTSPKVGFENATFAWDSEEDATFKLHDLNISFKVGKLNIIVGPTASGKSSLLLALLGEMNLIEETTSFLLRLLTRRDTMMLLTPVD